MATRRLHYQMPAKDAGSFVLFAFRCSACERDFHIDVRPEICPYCGVRFYQEDSFGHKKEDACPAS